MKEITRREARAPGQLAGEKPALAGTLQHVKKSPTAAVATIVHL